MFAAYYNFCWQTRRNGKSGKKRPTACMMAGLAGTSRLLTSFLRPCRVSFARCDGKLLDFRWSFPGDENRIWLI